MKQIGGIPRVPPIFHALFEISRYAFLNRKQTLGQWTW